MYDKDQNLAISNWKPCTFSFIPSTYSIFEEEGLDNLTLAKWKGAEELNYYAL